MKIVVFYLSFFPLKFAYDISCSDDMQVETLDGITFYCLLLSLKELDPFQEIPKKRPRLREWNSLDEKLSRHGLDIARCSS